MAPNDRSYRRLGRELVFLTTSSAASSNEQLLRDPNRSNSKDIASSAGGWGWLVRLTTLLILSNHVTLIICKQNRIFDDSSSSRASATGPADGGAGAGGFGDPSLSTVQLYRSTRNRSGEASSFSLAFEQSLGYFDDIPADVWIGFHRLQYQTTPHYVNPLEPDAHALTPKRRGEYSSARWQYYNWIPNFHCPRLGKVGFLGDGPKWVCDADRLARVVERRREERRISGTTTAEATAPSASTPPSECLIYSIGSNGNYMFEDGLVNLIGPVCEIHIFDPGNFERPGLATTNMHYHRWGLKSSYDSYVPKLPGQLELYTFQELRAKLGHENRTIDIFKIDCEGCEWVTYKDWVGANIRQILLETHNLPNSAVQSNAIGVRTPKYNASQFFDAFERNRFVLYHREVNSHWGFGECFEWSFLKLAQSFFEASAQDSATTA